VSQSKLDHVANALSEDGRWQWLYKIGGVAALISVVIIPISIVAYFVWPPFPDDILVVIQEDRLAGLMSLDFLYLLSNFFAIPLFLVLYVTLKRVSESFSAIALALWQLERRYWPSSMARLSTCTISSGLLPC